MTKSGEKERKNSMICKECTKECQGTAIYEIGDGIYIQCILTGVMWRKEDKDGLA